MNFSIIDSNNFYSQLQQARKVLPSYYVMYSSYLGGITKDPLLMLVPVDDHIVHRGDGVFEAIRICDKKLFDWTGHWERLQSSSEKIQLSLPFNESEVLQILKKMYEVSPLDEGIIRLYVSRGPGSFTANPYDCEKSHLHIIFTPFCPLDEAKYQNGVSVKTSQVSVKQEPWHGIKSCNYLPNVLMKKEAIDNHVDFCISVSDQGLVAEGSTENLAIIKDNCFFAPPFDYTLKGTTLNQVMRLARENKKQLGLDKIEHRRLTEADILASSEVFLVGTTLEVLPISSWNEKSVGPVKGRSRADALRKILQEDMKVNSDYPTLSPMNC